MTREVSALAHRFDGRTEIARVRDLHGALEAGAESGETYRLAGRVLGRRGQGKAAFLDLVDRSGKLQLLASIDGMGEAAYAVVSDLKLGDVIGCEGEAIVSRRGELSLRLTACELLAPCERSLPDLHHGLSDIEARYRQRYLDLMVNPEVRRDFEVRAKLVTGGRRYLDECGFLEVETPVLQPLYGGAFARPFVTRHHALDMDLYLRISNELYLKRLLVGGLERVYEFSRDFRNEGMDRSHNPEFTMLEYYQAFADLGDMLTLTEALVSRAVERARAALRFEYQGQPLDWTPPWPRLSLLDAVSAKVGEDVRALDATHLGRLTAARGIATRPGLGAGGLVDALFNELVQPGLVQPTFVLDYPAELSPLARASRTTPGVVERFELFAAGMELANAFSEQNDPEAQRRAFEDQMALRARGDEEAQMMDHDYVRALEYGMPPAGGVGIGVDRMTMLVCDARSIREVILFPQLRPEEGRLEPDEEPVAAGPGTAVDAGPGGPATAAPASGPTRTPAR